MAKKKKRSVGRKNDWATAKTLSRLNAVDIQMAKELGMTAKSLTKNVPGPSQQWKASVKEWIRGLYEKKFGDKVLKVPAEFGNSKAEKKKKKRRVPANPSKKTPTHQPTIDQGESHDDIPF